MTIKTEKILISTKGFNDVIDITSKIESMISSLEEKHAIINISIMSSTAGITIIENNKGIIEDINKLFENFAPINKVYQHDNLWHEGNAFAHLKSTIMGNNITVNVVDKKLALKPYQKIIVIDFDNKSAITKEISVNILY